MTNASTIYVVDDDRDVRHSIAFMLSTVGRRTRAFSSGEAFLDAIDALDPGCTLLDIRMPGLDGLDVLAALERRAFRWPVLVMTGHGELTLAAQAMRLGALDFIEKPFEEGLLLSCLARAATLLRGAEAALDLV